MLSGSGVPVEKYLLVEGQQYWFRNPQGIGNPISQPVKVFYRFKNDEKSSLGMPLPAGTVRVYQADSKGGIQFVGEDRIDHTPKDETLKIHVGNAFDVVCERKETDYKKIASNVIELEYQITLAQSQRERRHRRSPRTNRRRLGSAKFQFQMDEARRHHARIFDSGREGRNGYARLSSAREMVSIRRGIQLRGVQRLQHDSF